MKSYSRPTCMLSNVLTSELFNILPSTSPVSLANSSRELGKIDEYKHPIFVFYSEEQSLRYIIPNNVTSSFNFYL